MEYILAGFMSILVVAVIIKLILEASTNNTVEYKYEAVPHKFCNRKEETVASDFLKKSQSVLEKRRLAREKKAGKILYQEQGQM